MANLPVGDKGFDHPDEKTQPGNSQKSKDIPKVQGTKGSGVLSGFNYAGKSNNTKGSDYHDLGATSGLHGNFAQKDANISHLLEVNKQGVELRHYSGNKRHATIETNNIGPTAYNGRPIAEVHHPATSHGVGYQDPVAYRFNKKTTNPESDKKGVRSNLD